MLREAGALEVHVRISSPPVKWPCFYGIDFATRAELIANGLTIDQIRDSIGADSLSYVSLDGLTDATDLPADELCRACFWTGATCTAARAATAGQDLLEVRGSMSCGRLFPTRTPPTTRNRLPTRCAPGAPVTDGPASYAESGVDVVAGERAVDLMRASVAAAQRPEVVGDLGGFAGLFDASALRGFRRPLLATATDGVGTKIAVARALDRHDTIGRDLVAMVVDDLVVTGAEPLFLTDYIACGQVVPERIAQIVAGIAAGCAEAGCACWVETAEHPGLMAPDEYDLAAAGTAVVEADQMLGPQRVESGDVVLGLASSGLHSNGYSLARAVLIGDDPSRLDITVAELGRTVGEELLEPTRIYTQVCLDMIRTVGGVHALSHVTGGAWRPTWRGCCCRGSPRSWIVPLGRRCRCSISSPALAVSNSPRWKWPSTWGSGWSSWPIHGSWRHCSPATADGGCPYWVRSDRPVPTTSRRHHRRVGPAVRSCSPAHTPADGAGTNAWRPRRRGHRRRALE